MRKLVLFLMTAIVLFSCENDDSIIFDVNLEETTISFEAIPGGARMTYDLQDDSGISAIMVKYNDFEGKPVTIKGSYLSNVITLTGFIDEKSDIPVEISLIDREDNVSKSIFRKFSVKNCAAREVMNNVVTARYYYGFQVEYEGPELSEGFIHIAYLGTNPWTKETDTLLLETKPILKGNHILEFEGKCDDDFLTTAIVWTEDAKGNALKSVVFKDIKAIQTEKLSSNYIVNVTGDVEDDPSCHVGWQYLFNGDTKGVEQIEANSFAQEYRFYSKQGTVPGGGIIIEFAQPQALALAQMYCHLNANRPNGDFLKYYDSFAQRTFNYYPNHVIFYGSNDINTPYDQWEELGEFHEPQSLEDHERWNYPIWDINNKYDNADALRAADPSYATCKFKLSEEKFKYVRMEVLETFYHEINGHKPATVGRFSLQELEIYIAKYDN